MNIISVEKVLIYLFYLIPAFLILGPLLPELFFLLINIIFLIKNFSLKKIKIYVKKIFLIFTVLFCYIFINSFFQYLSNNLNELLLIKSFALLRFYFIYPQNGFQNLDKEIKAFFYIFISTISFVIFDVIFQYFFGSDIFGFKAFVPGTPTAYRLTGPFGDELIVGSYLSRFGIIYLFSLICLFKLTKNINEILILIFLVAVIFIIGERAAFLLFLFASVLLFFEKKKLKFLGIYTALFITLIVIVLNYDD